MLVLSRRLEEEIVIDGRIRIKVLTNGRGRVRLGISAPDDVRIERSEVVRGTGSAPRVSPRSGFTYPSSDRSLR